MNRFLAFLSALFVACSFDVSHASDNDKLYKLSNCHGYNNCLDLSAFNSSVVKYANNSANNNIVNYMLYLKRLVFNEWEYPYEARRQNITGSVNTGIILNKHGDVEAVIVVKSSGHEILDGEAVRAIKFASPYNVFPSIANEDYIYIPMDFNYCLPNMVNNYCK